MEVDENTTRQFSNEDSTVIGANTLQSLSTTSAGKKLYNLRECFDIIINQHVLNINSEIVSAILQNEFVLNYEKLTQRMQHILLECFTYYMQNWPEWKKPLHMNEREQDRHFQKFKNYLQFKLQFIIVNQNKYTKIAVEESTKAANTQTDLIHRSRKPESHYSLVICGQPNVINNVVFIELDNNIMIKQHMEKVWKNLTMTEFLNYPYVEVEVNLPGIFKLTRSNLHKYERYITECGDTATAPNYKFINYVVKNTSTEIPKVYSYEFMSTFFEKYAETIQRIPEINVTNQLQCIFQEFLQDVKATNLNNCTMGVPYTVCYSIGGNTFIRNKKMVVNQSKVSNERNAINFCEILTPRVAYSLSQFNVQLSRVQNEVFFTPIQTLTSANPQRLKVLSWTINNSITYKCLLCSKITTGERGYDEMNDHFRFLHKGEQAVLCFKCKTEANIASLAGIRWNHRCKQVDGDSAREDSSAGDSTQTPNTSSAT